MNIYTCMICGYEYMQTHDKLEKEFEDLPSDWTCPLCGAYKEDFEIINTDEFDE